MDIKSIGDKLFRRAQKLGSARVYVYEMHGVSTPYICVHVAAPEGYLARERIKRELRDLIFEVRHGDVRVADSGVWLVAEAGRDDRPMKARYEREGSKPATLE